MPLYKTIKISSETTIYIWKITESLEELKKVNLTKKCLSRLSKTKVSKHQKSFLSVRHLLKKAALEPKDLIYDTNGKPHLTDNRKIAITHSGDFSAIIISSKKVGIDIERKQKRIETIAPKFTTEKLLHLTQEEKVRHFTILWCVKESVYKAFSKKGLSMKEHINIYDLSQEHSQVQTSVSYKKDTEHYQAFFFDLENYICAYVIST